MKAYVVSYIYIKNMATGTVSRDFWQAGTKQRL